MTSIFRPGDGWSLDNSYTPGAVGTYMFCTEGFTSRSLGFGGTLAGSNLRPAALCAFTSWSSTNNNVDGEDANQSALNELSNYSLNGTWKCMGNGTNYSATSNNNYVNNATLWVRIS